MLNRKNIVIIGGGISGLSAGVYAEQHGFHAIILEKNPIVGGMCMGWYRKGRYIDGCIHWLTGTLPESLLYKMWTNIGAFSGPEDILQLESWGCFDYQGTKVTLWRDLDKAEKEWKQISPIDKKQIHHFFNMVRDFASVELPVDYPIDMLPFKTVIKMVFDVMGVLPSYLPSMKMSCEKYASKFKSPALRWAITHAQPGAGNLFSMIYSYASISKGDGGIPKGGSLPMTNRIRDKFLSLGGTIKYNSEVANILLRGKTAVGAILTSGEKIYGDYIITALDPNYVTHKLLLGFNTIPSLDKRFANPNKHPTPSCCVVTFDIEDLPSIISPYSFETEPFTLSGQTVSHLTLRSYDYDKETYVKGNKTICSVLIDQYSSDYQYWSDLYKDKTAYNAKKEELSNLVKERIIQKFPELSNKITILDCYTPKTLNRYVNTSRGAFMGFLYTDKSSMYRHNGHIKGINNLYMAGQWLQCPGGLPIAMMEGMFAVQRIAKKEKLSYLFVPRAKVKPAN